MATQKIHFFTGKGGVGKSLLAAGYSLMLARKSDLGPVLLAELNDRSFYKDFLKLESVSYSPGLVRNFSDNLFISQWNTTACLKEYALHLLKIEKLYQIFFENPISKSLIQVAPGLQELAILGKATSQARKHGPRMPFSEIVIDSFSTGHFKSLLRAPKAMAEVISLGPMAEQSRLIDQWIRDPSYSKFHIILTPDELSTTEGLELYFTLKSEFGIQAEVYLNRVLNLSSSDLNNLSELQYAYFSEKFENEKLTMNKLHTAGVPFKQILFQTEIDVEKLVPSISQNFGRFL